MESFIASEIRRLEQAGLRLRLFVIDGCDGAFLPELRRLARHRPGAMARVAAVALAQAFRSRPFIWSLPRKCWLEDFRAATALANRLLGAGDVAHLHADFGEGTTTTVTWLASIMTAIPFSFTAHATDAPLDCLHPPALLRHTLKAARFAVACTEAERRHIQSIANGTPVHRVYHDLDTDFTELLAQAPPRRSGNGFLRILGAGRLSPKDGFDVLVETCRILRQRGVPFQAVITGERGTDEAKLRRRAAELGMVEQVRVTEPMSQAELYLEYLHASVFSLPCRVTADGGHGIPEELMEAMACGVPVVTTRVSGIPELVSHGVNGLLVPSDDPWALADAIERIHRDPSLAQRLSCEARATVEAWLNGPAHGRTLAALFRQYI